MKSLVIYISGLLSGLLISWLTWHWFQKPRPSLRIIKYAAKQIAIRRFGPKKTVLGYSICPILFNEGNQTTTILTIDITFENVDWSGKHKPFKGEKYVEPGKDKLLQLNSILIDNDLTIPTDQSGSELPCKITINHTGSRKPLIDKINLQIPTKGG